MQGHFFLGSWAGWAMLSNQAQKSCSTANQGLQVTCPNPQPIMDPFLKKLIGEGGGVNVQ